MAHYQNIYNGGNGAPPVAQVAPRMTDWSGEVTPMPADPPMPEAPGRTVTSAGRPMDRLNAAEEQGGQSMGSLDMRNHLPSEVITDPISMEEAYRGSLKAMLKKNVGNYVVATFLGGDSVRCGQRLYDHLPGGPGPLHRLGHLFPEIHRVLRHPLPGHLRRGPPQRLDAQPGDVRKTVAAAAGMC